MSIEVKNPVDAGAEAAPMTMVESTRLAWPAAALTIGALSLAGWLMIILLIGWALR